MTSGDFRELELVQAARRVFREELRGGGLIGPISIPADRDEQQQLLRKIDALLARSDELGPRRAHLHGRPKTEPVIAVVTLEDALGSLRRTLVSRLMSGAVGSAATQLEHAISTLGPSPKSVEFRQALGELEAAKQLAEEEVARGKRENGEAEWLWEERRAELKARMADRRRDRWFTRDSIAALAGALLLLGFAAVLVVMMFQGKQPSDIISNAFLLILGFFFGQGTRGGKHE